MRILVADQNALLLAAITGTFGPHCDLVTATRRDVCIAQVEQHHFDVVIACDKLSDYTGLELLSEVGALSPDTLLIFAANSKRLSQLENRLAMFGLFEVLSYPITPRKLLDTLTRARHTLRTPSKPRVPHVVLESEWDTGVRLGLVERELQAEAEAAGQTEHDDWPTGAEASAGDAGDPGVGADDFVFSGPPVVSPVSEPAAPPPRAESRVRTFEATPVAAQRGSRRGGTEATAVTEYEVKPVIPALTHDTATISCDDEFIFASSEAVPVYASAEATAKVIEVEPVGVPPAQEPEPSIEEFCSNDPIFDVPEPPRWSEDGAANDTAYEPKSALPSHGRRGAGEASSSGRGRPTNESSAGLAYGAPGEHSGDAKSTAAYSSGSANGARHARTTGGSHPTPTGANGSGKPSGSRSSHSAHAGAAPRADASAHAAPVDASAHANAAPHANATPHVDAAPHASNASHQTGANGATPSESNPNLSQAKSSVAGKASGNGAKAPSPKGPPQQRARAQAVPTAAQRAAFERALARRNAESGVATAAPANGKPRKAKKGAAKTEPTLQAGSMDGLFSGTPVSGRSSLSQLARAATTKRPLAMNPPNLNKSLRPKRAVYAVGSGVAAVLILGVLSFELLRNSSKEAEHHMPHAPATSTQLFSSRTMMLENNQGNGVPQFGPPIQQAAASQDTPPADVPQAQTFDPNTAPEDPPPPPALENPGPMEPPSEVHTGPPLGMIEGQGSGDASTDPTE